MKPSCGFVLLLSLCIFFQQHIHAETAEEEDDVDNDDDGVVEAEPDKPPVIEVKKKYEQPNLLRKPHLAETFDNKEAFAKTWTQSEAKKEGTDESIAKYDGLWSVEVPKDSSLLDDLALVLKSKAKHYAIARKLSRPFEFSGKPLIVSYEVKFQNGIDCGGAYIKLLSKSDNLDLKSFHDKTPYTVMFGPDKCGLDHKLHFIFRHKNPKTGEIEEKHAKKPEGSLDKYFTDKKTHLYTLIVRPDNSYEVLVDNKVINSGDLLKDFNPPVIPPKEIDDPNDMKPNSWDEREKISDPLATKPEDWDEDQPLEVPDEEAKKPEGWLDDEEVLVKDPEASKPADWDDEMDGEWEAPLIDNPKCKDAPGCGQWTRPSIPNPLYKGNWKAPMIDNPNYQGEWKPKKIENPNWFEDKTPYRMTPINALGLELWSMTDDIVFDNFIVTDDKDIHESWVLQTWERKNTAEASSGNGQGIWSTLMSSAEERPWLYAVYVTVFLIPIVLLAICLCPRSGPIRQETLDAARKKTDESSPDDKPAVVIKESPVAGIGPAGDNSPRKSKKSKAALEKEEDGSEDEEVEDIEEEDKKEEEEDKKEEEEDKKEEEEDKKEEEEDKKEEEEDKKEEDDSNTSEEEKKEDVGKDSPRKSPRRRKPRKD